MKKIEDNKVYITKGTIMRLREELGPNFESPLISMDMFFKIAFDLNDPQTLVISGNSDYEFQEIIDEEAKEFVKNADWILDYDYYDKLSLDEIEIEFNKIADVFNPRAKEINDKIVASPVEKREEVYQSFRSEMAPMAFALGEIQSFGNKKANETDKAQKSVKKRTLKDFIRKVANLIDKK